MNPEGVSVSPLWTSFHRGEKVKFSEGKKLKVPQQEEGCGYFSLIHKTVYTRENFWNVYCFATNQKRDETAKDNHQTAACISHDLIRNNELAFSSNKLAFLPQVTFKNQSTEFGIDLEASVNCQNLHSTSFQMKASQLQKITDRKSPITANYHDPLNFTRSTLVSPPSDWFVIFCSQTCCLALSDPIYLIQHCFPVICH